MKFTVVIPFFRASKTIARALSSLVNQTCSDFEVIIIDDASSDFDEAFPIVELFKNKLDIHVLRNSINCNGAFSRNRGIEAARGEYVAFLDADDTWVENRLALAVALINTIYDKDFVAYGQFELLQHHQTGATLPLRGIKPDELVSEYVFAAGQPMQTSTFFCPLNTAKKVMFDESLTRHQDSDFMIRAQSKDIRLVFQNKKTANYYFNSSDINNRLALGRVNRLFCENWIRDKVEFFNPRSLAGYKLIVYSRVLYLEGFRLRALLTAFLSVWKLGVINSIDLIKTKLYIFLNSKLGFLVK